MVFSSLFFIFFFLPLVISLNLIFLNHVKLQNFILMLFSLIFYYWGEKDHVFIMLGCIIINYIAGILIFNTANLRHKKLYLSFGIILSLSILFYFKYFNFLIDILNQLFKLSLPKIAEKSLPLGISFYIFHILSYIIDIYLKRIKPERNLVNFIGYVSLFPQLVAGPIVRYKDIGHSFYSRTISRCGLRNGILRFCFGLSKKVLIANTIANFSDIVFNLPVSQLGFATAWLGAIAYMIQIYFDFSGYSDMAIGIGLMLGFRYKENFNFPYGSVSIQEFWRKWHISLSSWFRDYVYIPLGGNKVSIFRTYLNLIIVFTLCGFWHGANYTFIAWGLFHGVFLILERISLFKRFIDKLPIFLRHIYVLVVVCIGWVLFREDKISDAFAFIKVMFSFKFSNIEKIPNLNILIILAYGIGIIISLGLSKYICERIRYARNVTLIKSYRNLSMLISFIAFTLSIFPLGNNSYNPFLYFKF